MTHNLELALRESLENEAETVTGPPNPWPAFAAREARNRRSRRVRVSVLAAAVAALVGIQTNVIPLPGWAPGIAVAGRTPAFADAPTRGSLATDSAWLAGIRGHVSDINEDEGLWRVTDPDGIRVIYAGDIPGRRVAILLVRFRLGLITSWNELSFSGPVGATPDQMEEGGTGDATSPVTFWTHGDAVKGGVALVVGPPGSTTTMTAGFEYIAEGVIARRPLATTNDNGTAFAQLPATPQDPDPNARVVHRGQVIFDGSISSGWSDGGAPVADDVVTEAILEKASEGARGTSINDATLANFIGYALQDSHLTTRDTTIRVWWSGQVNGKAATLLTIQPTGGGVIAYALHGDNTAWSTDLRLLLPANGAYTRPLAWRMRAEGNGDQTTDWVQVVAPAAAARVTITVEGEATPLPVTIDGSGHGVTNVPPDKPATVTAFDANAKIIATTPIPPFEREMGHLPGASRSTRIVD